MKFIFRLLALLAALLCLTGLGSPASAQSPFGNPTLSVSPTAALVGEKITATLTGTYVPPNVDGPFYFLDWGDGTVVGAAASLTHVYSRAGTFTVRLLRNGNPVTSVAPIPVVISLPAPTLAVSPSAVQVGEKVTATLTNIVPGSHLDWGDGMSVSAETSLNHIYSKAGAFTIRLTDRNQSSIPSVPPAVVTVTAAPIITLKVVPTAVQTGQAVTAIISLPVSTGTTSVPTYVLDWGDGTQVLAEATLTHAYSKAGTFTVQLLAKESVLNVPPVTVTVTDPVPTTTLTVSPTAALVGEKITAALGNLPTCNPCTSIPLPSTLDWGDDTVVAAAASLTHAYGKAGTFIVRLLYGGKPNSEVAPVPVVVSLPTPTLSVSPNAVQTGENVTALLTNLQTGDQLDWGDGAVVAAAPSLNHAYAKAGVFTVRLLRAGTPLSGLPPAIVTVTAPLPTPTLNVSPSAVQTGEKVTATLTGFQPGDQLDWGDGTKVPAVGSLTHTYGKAGTFLARLLDANARPYPATAPVPVVVSLPLATLNVSPNAVQTGEKVTATLTNLQPGDQLDWGDGAVVPAETSLQHAYTKAGTFAVRLLRGGQPVAGVAPVPVVVSLPIPNLSVSPNAVQIDEKVTATLTNLQPSDQLDWGDSATVQAAASLSHSYNRAGTFAVRLLRSGQPVVGVAPVPVVVSLPIPTLSVTPNAVQVGEQVTATLTDFQPGDQLDWGDTSVVSAAASLSHSYSKAEVYIVRLLRGGAPVSGIAPVPVTVTALPVICSVEVLTVSPLLSKPVSIKVNGLPANLAYSLDWGDGTTTSGVSSAVTNTGDGAKANLQQHSYAKVGTFVIKGSAQGVTCVQPITVTLGNVALAVDPANPVVDQLVTLSVGDLNTGTALKVDWGDGTVQNLNVSGAVKDGNSPLGTHAYLKDATFIVKVSLAQTGEPLGILPVVVGVPLPTLSVTPARAGTPSTVNVGNIQSYPQYVYTLDFGDGTPKQSVKADADVPHIFAVSGVYTVKLTLKADQAAERTVVVVAVIDAAVGIEDFGTEVRPQAKAAIPAPTPAELQVGTPADSVALLNVTGSGTVNLRWTWTPLNVKDQPDGQPLTLETRQVPLQVGQNSAALKLPTGKSGRYLLRVEVLGVTGDSKAAFPGQISLQTVNLTEPGLPKFLVVGEGEDQFRFEITGANKPQTGPPFNPDHFSPFLKVAADSPFVVGLTPVALRPITASDLKVKMDGDTAYLLSGSFTAQPKTANDSPYVLSTVYTEFPAFSPMRLRVGRVTFSPSGAVLNGAVVTSPDLEQVTVFKKPPNYTTPGVPGPKGPQEIMQGLINQIFDPAISLTLTPGGIPVATPVNNQRLGMLSTVYAQGQSKDGSVSDVSAPSPFLKYTQTGQLPTSTGAGIGYVTEKGRTILDQAASKGVYTGNGVGDLTFAAPIVPVVTAKTVEQLQEVLSSKQVDFLVFPELYLSNNGDVVSARIVGGKSVASFPSAAISKSALLDVLGGVLKLGDSGVSMDVFGMQTVYLDLSSSRSVEPDGYAANGSQGAAQNSSVSLSEAKRGLLAAVNPSVSSQAELLRTTYGGAPSAVLVPDVEPKWQGLLWLSNQLTIDTVYNKDATKGDSEEDVGKEQKLSVQLVKKVPVSYGTRGWNLDIEGPNGQVVPGSTRLSGGIPMDASEVVVVMVKTNLIRSLVTGAFGPLPFVGGGKLTGSWDMNPSGTGTVTLDKTGLTRAYGPDGSFTAKEVTGGFIPVNGREGFLSFTLLGSTFDLSRVGSGLKVNCSPLLIDGGLAQLSLSTCASIQGPSPTVAGTPLTLDSVTFKGGSPADGQMILSGSVALGNADENSNNITAPARFVLSADAQTYSLKLKVDDMAQQISSTTGNPIDITLKGSQTNLTGVGAQAFGAGPAGSASQEISFDSGTVGVSDKLSMQVKGLFGHKGSKSYWYLLATGKAADGIPLSIITIYQITGGLAYNMQWGKGQIYFSDLNKRPNDATGLHLAAGVVASFTGVDDATFHAAIVAELSGSPLKLSFGGDGYLLTGGINSAGGYFGGGHPQARFAATVNANGLFVDLCVGPAEVGDLRCSDLKPLSLAGGVVTVQGAASIELSKTSHIYIGTFRPKSQIGAAYCNPTDDAACAALYRTGRVSVTVDLAIIKSTIDGYVMTGILDGRAPSFVDPGSFGLAAGASIENIYHAGDSGSLLLCNYSWSFDARLFAAVDGAIVLLPNPYIYGHVGLYAGASVSAHLCVFGGSISASVSLDANFQLGNGSNVDGTAHVQIALPGLPDVDFKTHVHLGL
ncbi:PKD domain-containing protein [Deinococcus detaillensis]|nr:PKD domain-containing protein [Deinococcus detaillensis]